MSREYVGYLADAFKNGMTGEEVTSLFNDIYKKSNTKNGKRVLRLFAKGIGSTKKKSLNNSAMVAAVPPVEPQKQAPTVGTIPGVGPQYQFQKVYEYKQ